jgi:hypothetical protein
VGRDAVLCAPALHELACIAHASSVGHRRVPLRHAQLLVQAIDFLLHLPNIGGEIACSRLVLGQRLARCPKLSLCAVC